MSDGLKFNTTMDFAYGVADTMAPGIQRIVANNASALTFKGTNTYLVGTDALAVIDPGPADEAHTAAILKAAAGRPITHIFVTHAHRDHVDGTAALKAATGAAIYGFPRSSLSTTSAEEDSVSEYVNTAYVPEVSLAHDEFIEGEGWAFTALHTPGHAADHLCFALSSRDIVFSGDHVMAWNTSVVAPPEGRMADYLRSLEVLLKRHDEMLLPGHGGPVSEPRRMLKAYLLHRRWRDQAILEAVRNGADTVRKLMPVIYRDLNEEVAGAARLSLRAHLEHLAERGLITCADAADVDCVAVPL
jgi:glyoxylase-like metal-dependent hydrolase (beta-lactamase superfamily II)